MYRGRPWNEYPVMGANFNAVSAEGGAITEQIAFLALIGTAHQITAVVRLDDFQPRLVRVGVHFISLKIPHAQILVRDEDAVSG